MLKTIWKLATLIIIASVIAPGAKAYDFESDGIYYDVLSRDEATVEVTLNYVNGASTYTGNVDIPETVTYGGITYSVVAIGAHAFHYCPELTSVAIPNTIKSIGEWAFYNCSNLTSVKLPNSIITIGDSAFKSCYGLTSIIIPNSVITIEDGAFFGCSYLTSLTIGNSVKSIGAAAFGLCGNLERVQLPNSIEKVGEGPFSSCGKLLEINIDDNAAYCTIDGVLFNKNRSLIVQCPGAYSGKYSIPGSVLTIGGSAFSGCHSLTAVDIPNSVTSIRDDAFYYCGSLTALSIPNCVSSIGAQAFMGCAKMEQINIPTSIISIGARAFYLCGASFDFEFPVTLKSIGNDAFSGCKGTSTILLPKFVEQIGDRAFRFCKGVISVNIGESVTTIGEMAFTGCENMVEINVNENNPYFSSLDGVLFDKARFSLIQCPGGYAGDYSIPNSVKTIVGYAFSNCTALKSVNISDSTIKIGEYAFWNCKNMTSVTIPNSITSIGQCAFGECQALETIYSKLERPSHCEDVFSEKTLNDAVLYIPTGRLRYYRFIKQWSQFSNIVEIDYSGLTDVEARDDMPFEIYTVSGVYLFEGSDISDVRSRLPKGIYILRRSDGSTKKISI